MILKIQVLIENNVGDIERLEHIKYVISKGKELYDSDKHYLESLLNNFENKKSKTYESEPEITSEEKIPESTNDSDLKNQLKEAQKKIEKLEKKTQRSEELSIRSQYHKSEGTTLAFSVILGLFGIQGVGYFYIGKIGKGIGFLVIGLILFGVGISTISVFFGAIPLAGYFILFIWQILDSRNLCRQYNLHLSEVGKRPW